MADELKSHLKPDDKTRVDLGEDLLSSTSPSIHQTLEETKKKVEPQEILQNLFQDAKIFANEGLIEDAKKALRKVLIIDPHHVQATENLKMLAQEELKQLFNVDHIKPRYSDHSNSHLPNVEASILVDKLNQDLDLNILELENQKNDDLEIYSFFKILENQNQTLSVEQWVDLGIAFLEMEHSVIALKIFEKEYKKIDSSNSQLSDQLLSVGCLLAFTYIHEQKPYDAIRILRDLLRNEDIKKVNKIELFYLMGRSYELVNDVELAKKYFESALEINPNYRDAKKRISKKL